MLMKEYIQVGLISLLLITLFPILAPAADPDYLPLNDEPAYCARYGISDWCASIPFVILNDAVENNDLAVDYVNEYASNDNLRYSGPLKITSIAVTARIQSEATVTAIYKVINLADNETASMVQFFDVPFDFTVSVNGEDALPDEFDQVNLTFLPGEEKEMIVEFSERLYGNLFGYNVNLVFDNRIPDNRITHSGVFEFTLPENAIINKCVPAGYTTSSEGSRHVVTWHKTDFVPWTNPFNDLICKWNVTETAAGGVIAPKTGGDSTVWYVLLAIVAIACTIFFYKKRMQR